MEKVLTGQIIYEAQRKINSWNTFGKWEYIALGRQDEYNQLAELLNQQLGLCKPCSTGPANGELHECADM